MSKYFTLILFSLVAATTFATRSVVFASTTDGTVSGYAWSDKIGWINFGVATGNIHITDTAMSGYAWSDNYGWINLAPTKSGVKNDSGGSLSGSAWGWNLGWIDFSSVTVNSSGTFTGTATGDNAGTINFSCDQCNVTTDWRPASSRASCGDGSCNGTENCSSCLVDCGVCSVGGGSGTYNPPKPPLSISINQGNVYANNKNVLLNLEAGFDIKEVLISNYSDFRDGIKSDFQETKNWNLADGDGEKIVYVKFYTYFGVVSDPVSDGIILDTQSPQITITSIKDKYSQDEDILVAGKTDPDVEINIFLDNKYGNFSADRNGDWFVTFGKLGLGSHSIEMFAKDLAGNISQPVKLKFLVLPNQVVIPATPSGPLFFNPIIERIQQGLKPLMPTLIPQSQVPIAKTPILENIGQGLFSMLHLLPSKQQQKLAIKKPTPVVMVPKEAPPALAGNWNVFPMNQVRAFVLSPLPKDIAILKQKFPALEKTFKDVGVAKITDVQKIKNANLSLPGLAEVLGIPVAKLTPENKTKIPSEIIFAKTGGGLIDYKIALSLNNKGQTQQKITTITASPLQLIFKAEGKVKKVKGYIIFKSKKPAGPVSALPLDSLSFSSIFSAPNFTAALAPTIKIPLEGAMLEDKNLENIDLEKRLVLSEFDYQDTGNGVYTANVQAPVVDGEYEIITVVEYEETFAKEVKLITVVDPEGYVYEKEGDKETRILGSVVSLYWQNPQTKQYELWKASDYQQENPQTTDVRGTYSFLVPEGYYYLKVDAPGYLGYDGKPFQVKEGSGVHINIELKTKYWWLNIVDWKTVLLILVILLLLYNFYRDKKRDRWMNQQKL